MTLQKKTFVVICNKTVIIFFLWPKISRSLGPFRIQSYTIQLQDDKFSAKLALIWNGKRVQLWTSSLATMNFVAFLKPAPLLFKARWTHVQTSGGAKCFHHSCLWTYALPRHLFKIARFRIRMLIPVCIHSTGSHSAVMSVGPSGRRQRRASNGT